MGVVGAAFADVATDVQRHAAAKMMTRIFMGLVYAPALCSASHLCIDDKCSRPSAARLA